MPSILDNYRINANVKSFDDVRRSLLSLQPVLRDLSSTTSGLGTMSTQDADSVAITGGSITGITDLAVSDGGTGASTAAGARTNLGLVIGTNVQAWDAQLDDIAALAVTDSNFIVGNGSNWVAENGATARTSLGLGTIATQNYDNVNIDGGTADGLTIATSDITVGAGKTLDVSAGTLTLANDQISGDKISGGTIDTVSIDADNNTLTNVGLAEFDTDTLDSFTFLIGCTLDTASITVSSDGATITLSMEKSGGGDVRFFFSDGVHDHDCTPADTVTLTAGSDASPQINYIYILQSTKALTVSTTGWPSAEFAHIATVMCQSSASLQTDGPYKVHVWTDHVLSESGTNQNGHLAHLNRWMRGQNATWVNGVALTPTITVNGGAEDNVDIDTTSGTVLQLHEHTYPVFDTSVSSEVYVVNYNGANYTKVTDLNSANQDDSGNAITNNKHTLLVIWGIISEATSDSKIMVNLPSGFYVSEADAIADTLKYANYTIPTNYRGTGFLIARLCLKYTTASSGTWTIAENLDLRGTFPSVTAGGSEAISTEFADNNFLLYDETDSTKEMQLQLSGITTGNTRTLTVPDSDGTILLDGDIGSTVQEYDAFLTSIAALGTAADKIIYTTASDTAAEADITSFGRSFIDDADSNTALGTLGLSTNLADLTDDEAAQLENIGITTISAGQWGYLGALDQSLATTDSPTFNAVTVTSITDGTATLTGGTITGATLTTPTISDFTNATHDHSNNAGGGTISFSILTSTPTTLAGYGITDAQGLDAELTALAGLTSAADKVPYFTGSETAAVADFTSYGRSIVAVANEASFKTLTNLESGIDIQAYDAGLTSIAGLTTAADKMIYTTALDTYAVIDLTAFARSILDDVDEATFKATVNLEIGTDVLAQQTIGIANDNLIEVDGTPNSGEYAKFTANGLEGRIESEFKADFNLEIGTDVQAYDDTLQSISALGTAADKMVYTTALDTWSEASITSFGRSLIDDANAAAALGTLGLSTNLPNLTDSEVSQYENMDSTTVSTTQWGYLGAMNQGVATTNSPTFNNLNLGITFDQTGSSTGTYTVAQFRMIDSATNKNWGFIHRGSLVSLNAYDVNYYDGASHNVICRFTTNKNMIVGGTSEPSPVSRIVSKGSTSDGSTDIYCGQDSGGNEMFAVDTDGNQENKGTITAGDLTVAGKGYVYIKGDDDSDDDPGCLVLYDHAGTPYYLWVDNTGDLRIHTAAPTDEDADGTVVGAQS